jgi:hypothetical protein
MIGPLLGRGVHHSGEGSAAQIPTGFLSGRFSEPEGLPQLGLGKIRRHAALGEVIYHRVFDGGTLNRRAPAGGEDFDAQFELGPQALDRLALGEAFGWGPFAGSAHPMSPDLQRRVHHRKQVPAFVQDAVADITDDVAVRSVLGGL